MKRLDTAVRIITGARSFCAAAIAGRETVAVVGRAGVVVVIGTEVVVVEARLALVLEVFSATIEEVVLEVGACKVVGVVEVEVLDRATRRAATVGREVVLGAGALEELSRVVATNATTMTRANAKSATGSCRRKRRARARGPGTASVRSGVGVSVISRTAAGCGPRAWRAPSSRDIDRDHDMCW